jgi:hypothetical protein
MRPALDERTAPDPVSGAVPFHPTHGEAGSFSVEVPLGQF